MEEAQEILLNSLEKSGVAIPPGVLLIRDLTPASLFLICSQFLEIVNGESSSFPTTLPDSMTDRFKICTEMAEAIKNLGYVGNMSFHKFLYPSEEDLYKLVRFLIEKLSESPESGNFADMKKNNARIKMKEEDSKSTSVAWMEKSDNQGVDVNNNEVRGKLKDLRLETEVLTSGGTQDENILLTKSHEAHITPQVNDVVMDEVSSSRILDFHKEEPSTVKVHKEKAEESGTSRRDTYENEETVSEIEQKVVSLEEQKSKIRGKIGRLQNQEKVLKQEVKAKNSKLEHQNEELELLKAATEMAFDNQHPAQFYIEQLNDKVDAKRRNLVELESQWDASLKTLEEKKRSLEESVYADKPEVWVKYQKLKEVEMETQSILSEIEKREEEHSKLSADLAKQAKGATRRSYIERITDITKNSRKLDADIERILQETRELQLESNSIQERLHRTYAVVDETVFREAKKDPVGKQAYRLLTSIHESFEQISEKILATDRVRREVADHEAKLAAMASRTLNIDKLQADLDAIKKENEFLELRLRDE